MILFSSLICKLIILSSYSINVFFCIFLYNLLHLLIRILIVQVLKYLGSFNFFIDLKICTIVCCTASLISSSQDNLVLAILYKSSSIAIIRSDNACVLPLIASTISASITSSIFYMYIKWYHLLESLFYFFCLSYFLYLIYIVIIYLTF